MNKLLSTAVLSFFGLAGAAHAATLDVGLGSTNVTPLSYSTGGTLTPNINLTAAIPGTLSLTGLAFLENSTSGTEFVQPTGTLFGGNYLAVIDHPGGPIGPGPSGTATFNLSGQNVFAFTWGTIDSYNTLTLTDSRSVVYTISGTEILNHILGSVDGATQSDVSFNDPFGQIVSAKFTTTNNSFEAANFAQSQTPLPASLPLFAAGLLGLVFLARRDRVRS